ncbi:MAG TPA: M20 family metallopeptidase [Acidimicrobiales bacterium]|nr:M20 family metallopeptidase [Acidimicrobiales bacterium]
MQLPVLLADLEQLVTVESPSADKDACHRCADAVAQLAGRVLGVAPERIVVEGSPHLRWRFGEAPTRVLLVGHFDTVWPLGALAELPFAVNDGVVTGPGCFDMKAGVVMALHALASLDDLDGAALLLNSDEETGSLTSRALIEDTARGARAALVLEPPHQGALKTARKGVGFYRLDIAGRAAHAGLEPEKGANALVALADAVRGITAAADAPKGTTVTPTTASAGTTRNVVPAQAAVEVDVRGQTQAELERVDAALRALQPTVEGTTFAWSGGINRPPLEPSASASLFARAQRLAADLGLQPLRHVAVGGGSDGNFTAGIGVPTLDGLGADGDGAHARTEHVVAATMLDRTRLLAALVQDLLVG